MIETNRPLRVLERAIQGGLGHGNLGLIASRHGTGKVAVLASIALDHAMHEKNTLTVTIGDSVDNVRVLHDEVYDQLAKHATGKLPDALQVERHKQIYAFREGSFTIARLRETLELLKNHAQFVPELIEIQGWPDFKGATSKDDVAELKKVAVEANAEIWFTAQIHRDDDQENGLPSPVAAVSEMCSVILTMAGEGDRVALKFAKTHGEQPSSSLKLEFDPNTMLLRWR